MTSISRDRIKPYLNITMTTRCASSDADHRSVVQTSVGFATVSVRQFSYTLGDSPSTTCGPPTALSWSYSCPDHLNGISIERYEALCHPQDQPRRSRRELKMSVQRRRQILLDVCDDNDDTDDIKTTTTTTTTTTTSSSNSSSSSNSNELSREITPELIAKAERRVERRRLRLERNRAYANMTTYFPRRSNNLGSAASFPPNKQSRCDAMVDLKTVASKGEWNIDMDQRNNASWGTLLSSLDASPAYLKAAERKAELLREELFLLPKTSATNACAISNYSSRQQQQSGARLFEQHAVAAKNDRPSKQRSFNSRAA